MSEFVERDYGHNDLGAKTLLIIGNGFDLDLGLKTRYIDYANSGHWPFKKRRCFLGGYLNHHKDFDEWFDLEAAMAKYCGTKLHKWIPRKIRVIVQEKDYEDDEILIKNLEKYLKEEMKRVEATNSFKKTSVAARLLQIVCNSLVPGTIYSFNYTDLKTIANNIGINAGCYPNYVHGELTKGNVILGFNECSNIPESYKYFIKFRRTNYVSSSLSSIIGSYNNIIFHGLSFGEIDSIYFKDFFQGIIEKKYEDKYVRIITKNESSRQSIFTNLNKLTGNDFALYNESNFSILSSDGNMKNDIDAMLDRLNDGCQ